MVTRGGLAAIVCVSAACSIGCAARRQLSAADLGAPPGAFATYIAEVRRLSAEARPVPTGTAATLESRDPALRDALQRLKTEPGPASHDRVAEAYRRAGVPDAAYGHYMKALALDTRDPVAYEGLARLWRDWHFPQFGMGDAQRAIYYSHGSASAYNTLGTLLAADGQLAEARIAFGRALVLDPHPAYAWANICYVDLQAGDPEDAMLACRQAIAIDPALVAAHNNLALVYAAQGDMTSAAAEFRTAGGSAAEAYNMGLVLSAKGRFAEAAQAFDAARAERPDWKEATDRAGQAKRKAQQPADGRTSHDQH